MDFVETRDGTRLYVKDWGRGKPVVFVHSWALNADMWQYQMVDLVDRGHRCVAYDKRGHGRSSQPDTGYDYDRLADDLASVLEQLDLRDVTLVGHSMGGGEIVRHLSRHGASRVARIALLASTTPFVLKTADNPDGVDRAMFDFVRAAIRADFPRWLEENARPFVTPETSDAMLDWLKGLMLQCSLRAALECNVAVTETDLRADLRAITLPTLIIHGDADASAPLGLTGERSAKLIANARLEVYRGAPHGLFVTHRERLNADLHAFISGS